MSKTKAILEVIKTSIDLTGLVLFFTPAGGAAMIWGGITWAKTNIPKTSLIWLAVGLFLIVVPLMVFAIARFIKRVKRQLKKPEDLIFPYIESVDASQIQCGKNFVWVRYCYPSALQYDLTFLKTRCTLNIANNSTMQQEMSPLVIKKQINNYQYWEIPLTDKIPESVKDNLKNHIKMQFVLYVTCWDSDGNEHHLNTDIQREMIAFA